MTTKKQADPPPEPTTAIESPPPKPQGPTILPASFRTKAPCPIIEHAFARLEALCPFPDLLLEEARQVHDCTTSGALQIRHAETFVSAAMSTIAQPDLALTGFERLAGLRGSAAYAYALLREGRNLDAVTVACDVLAGSIGYRRGDEEGQRALWEQVIGYVGSARRVR